MVELNTIKGLVLKIRATRLHLVVLAGVRAFWPVLLLVSGFAFLAFIGVFERVPARFGALAGLGLWLGGVYLAWRGWRRYKMPSDREARKALDQSSELRPIASLTDRPSRPSLEGQKLWDEHTQRLKQAAHDLPLPWFGRLWKQLDPYMLRAVLPALLIVGIIGAGGAAGDRFGRAVTPDIGVLLGAEDVSVEAWITPPDHTRKPPVFLRAGLEDVRVPAGSQVTVRARARSAPRLVLRGDTKRRRAKFDRTPDGAFEVIATLTENTDLSVNWWGKRAGWRVLASPDDVPTAEFVEVPVLGENDRTELTWKVSDDYGVTKLELALKLVEPHPAAPDDERREQIELPAPSVESASEADSIDLTRHAWAGLMVEARLVATDGGGNEGQSAPHEFILPDKLFLQSLARAVQDIRVTVLREPRPYGEIEADPVLGDAPATVIDVSKRLEAAPEGIQRAWLMLEAVTYAPYRFFGDYEPFLGLSAAQGRLKAARTLEEAASVDNLLWAIALKAEYGSAADALAALLAAKKALEKALRDGASEEEIARLTDAFRQAAENYVEAKLAEAIANGLPEGAAEDGLDNQQAGGEGQGLGQNSFEDMLSALEDLTETGATDQARQLLSDITNMLENLEFQQGNGEGGDGFALPSDGSQGEEGEQSEQEQELSEQAEDLADALREQRELNDDTLEAGRRERDRQRQEAREGQEGGQDGGEQSGQEAGEGQGGLTREELANRQAQIGELLERLAQGEAGGGEDGEGQAGGDEEGDEERGGGLGAEALEDVLNAQRRAESALRDGQFRNAQRNQERVIEGLRGLAGDLAAQLDELNGEEGEESRQNDPFGNPVGGNGGSDDIEVPEQSERQRALDILEELRRRYDEATDPEEREYLKRLLDRF